VSDAVQIGGRPHPIALPTSLVDCQEIHDFAYHHAGGVTSVRAFAALAVLCIPSLRPPGLPAWNGENGSQIGKLAGDHLMRVYGLSPMKIVELVKGADLFGRLRAAIPAEEEIQTEIKNS